MQLNSDAEEQPEPIQETDQDADQEEAQSTATAKPKADRKPKSAPPKVDKLPPYKVLLHNDDHNDMEHVAMTIVELTPLKQYEAIRKMFEAHQRGLTLLLTTHKERAELYQEQFKSKGLTVTIEPA